VLAAAALVVAVPSAPAAAPCSPRGSKGVANNSKARVFRIKSAYYGCLYRLNKSVRLTLGNDPEGSTVGPIALAGNYVALVEADRVEDGPDLSTISVFSLATRKRTFSTRTDGAEEGDNEVLALVMNTAGSVAWTEGPSATTGPWEVRKRDSGGLARLDSGPGVAPTSLGLSTAGNQVYWTNGATFMTAPLN
jgi:hypothetical protein